MISVNKYDYTIASNVIRYIFVGDSNIFIFQTQGVQFLFYANVAN